MNGADTISLRVRAVLTAGLLVALTAAGPWDEPAPAVLALVRATTAEVYACAAFPARLLSTTDDGRTWSTRFQQATTGLVTAHAPATAPDRLVIVGQEGEVWRRGSDGAFVALDVDLGTTVRAAGFDASGRGLAVGDDGLLALTEDHGLTWRRIERTSQAEWRAVAWADARRVAVSGGTGELLVSTDGGRRFTPRDTGTREPLFAVATVGPRTLWIAGRGGTLRRSDDGGETWQAITTDTTATLFALAVTPQGDVVAAGAGGTCLLVPQGADRARPLSTDAPDADWLAALVLTDHHVLLAGRGAPPRRVALR